jgi:hypothetical protein
MTTTLSQLVDDMVRETSRYDLLLDIARYANQTIREVHAEPERNRPINFPANRNEIALVAAGSTLAWDIPDSSVFQMMEAVRYDSVLDVNGDPVWATPMGPAARQQEIRTFYYRTRNTYAFAGFGGQGATVSLSWFEYPPELAYYAPASRPASFSPGTGWTYGAGINTPELQDAARLLSYNWLLDRWEHLIAEGLRAKVYKRLSDETRSRTSYSMFQAQRGQLVAAEAFEAAK